MKIIIGLLLLCSVFCVATEDRQAVLDLLNKLKSDSMAELSRVNEVW